MAKVIRKDDLSALLLSPPKNCPYEKKITYPTLESELQLKLKVLTTNIPTVADRVASMCQGLETGEVINEITCEDLVIKAAQAVQVGAKT